MDNNKNKIPKRTLNLELMVNNGTIFINSIKLIELNKLCLNFLKKQINKNTDILYDLNNSNITEKYEYENSKLTNLEIKITFKEHDFYYKLQLNQLTIKIDKTSYNYKEKNEVLFEQFTSDFFEFLNYYKSIKID